MTKTEYNNWVDDTCHRVDSCKNNGVIDVVFNHNMTFVMIIDLITMKTASQEIKDGNTREATAIAFTKLKEGKIPEVTDTSEYERVRYGNEYYVITTNNSEMLIGTYTEMDDEYNKEHFDTNNYFYTGERAEGVLNKIKMLLWLERLHDAFCPDYVPNWSNREEEKFYIYFDYDDNEYKFCSHYIIELSPITCFPTVEVAKAVCDILNKEVKNK